jgi:DNA-directed RNA polymerase subunit RPC12/RpoP
MFKFRCIHCDKKIAVPTEFAGKPLRCPNCGDPMIVPFPSPEELEAAEEIGFSVRQAPSMALSSRACKQCGAILPPSGACIQCRFEPGESLKAAFDASLATMFAAPAPAAVAATPARAWRSSRGGLIIAIIVIGVVVLGIVAFFLFT